MKLKTFSKIAFVLMAAMLAATSCDDAKIAEKIEGSWKGNVTTTDADGTKSKETQTYLFTHVADDMKEGGTLVENRVGKCTMEEDGYKITVAYTVTIEGEYEVLAGDLDIKYDVSTLEVSVDNLDFGLSDDATLGERTEMLESLADGSYYEVHSIIEREAKQDLYHDQYELYQQANQEEGTYSDVSVEGDELSFETADMGRVTLKRVKPSSKATL